MAVGACRREKASRCSPLSAPLLGIRDRVFPLMRQPQGCDHDGVADGGTLAFEVWAVTRSCRFVLRRMTTPTTPDRPTNTAIPKSIQIVG